MKCPICQHEWKDEGRSKGGRTSKRKITPAQQAKMQKARSEYMKRVRAGSLRKAGTAEKKV